MICLKTFLSRLSLNLTLILITFCMGGIVFNLTSFQMKEAQAHDPIADVQQTVNTLAQDIDAVTEQITDLSSRVDQVGAADVEQLRADIAKANARLDALRAELEDKIQNLEAGGAVDIAVINALRADLDQLAADVAGISLTGAEALQVQITAHDAAIKALQLRPVSVDRSTAVPPLRLHGLPHGSLIEHRPMFKQVNLIDVEFTIDQFVAGQHMALITRDESGCDEGGQFSLYINKERRLGLRTQALGCQPEVQITSNQQLEAGTPHRVQVVNGPTRTVVFLDGVEIGSSEHVNSWEGNTLPLIFGSTCWHLKRDVCISEPTKRKYQFKGSLAADIYAARKVFVIQ